MTYAQKVRTRLVAQQFNNIALAEQHIDLDYIVALVNSQIASSLLDN